MALKKKVVIRWNGATGNYMAVQEANYNNTDKLLRYTVALYANEQARRDGLAPLSVVYNGCTDNIPDGNAVAAAYADIQAQLDNLDTWIELSGEDPGVVKPVKESDLYRLFHGAETV